MGRLKKVIVVMLCVITIALCAIVNTSALETPPEQNNINVRTGFTQFTINDYLDIFIAVCEEDEGLGLYPSQLILARNFGEANLLCEKWTKETGVSWYIWGSTPITFSNVVMSLSYVDDTQRVVIDFTDELLTDGNLQYDLGYAPRYVINFLRWGDGGSANIWSGTDWDVQRHFVQTESTYPNGDPMFNNYFAFRFYDEFTDINEIQIQYRIESYAYYDSSYDAENSEYNSFTTVFNRPLYSVRSFGDGEYERGKSDGYSLGWQEGFTEGSKEQVTTEFNMETLINGILNAPFELLRTALDFEIFGVNMAGFATFIITALILLVVITFFLKVVL